MKQFMIVLKKKIMIGCWIKEVVNDIILLKIYKMEFVKSNILKTS